MSRHELPGLKAGTTVVVGWDAPLQTFFLQVYRPGRRSASIWKGGAPSERMADIEDLRREVRPYAVLPPIIASALIGEQDGYR